MLHTAPAAADVTIACDIDGVIAPVTARPDLRDCVELPHVNYGTHVLVRAVAALKGWHASGAQVTWHSTWRSPYTDELADALNLPAFEHFASEEEFLFEDGSNTWWKLRAIQRWLRERPAGAQLIWIDDDIKEAVDQGEIDQQTLADPRLTIVSPELDRGLSAAWIRLIAERVRQI